MARLADVDVRLLRVFRAVVESGGFSAAQTKLDTTTSTISLHITELEKRLGFRLCQRGRAGFALTDRGFITYEQTKRLLNTLDDQFDSILSLRKRLAGKIRIGIVDSLITHPDMPIVKALRKFNRLDHDVEVQLLIDERMSLEQRVQSQDLHAAISPFVRAVAGLDFHRVLIERHKLYCAKGHPLFGKNTRFSRGELLGYPFVLRSYLGRVDEDRFSEMRIRGTANNMEAMLMMILSGAYIGLLPDHTAQPWVDRGELTLIDAPEIEHVSHHSLVVPRAMKLSAAAATLVPLILAEVNAVELKKYPHPLEKD